MKGCGFLDHQTDYLVSEGLCSIELFHLGSITGFMFPFKFNNNNINNNTTFCTVHVGSTNE
jgi:hypothetical protein